MQKINQSLYLTPFPRKMRVCILCRISRWLPKLVGKIIFGKKCLMILRITWGSKISLKSIFFTFSAEFQDGRQIWRENVLGKNWQMTMWTPWGSTILLKSLSHTVSEINAFYTEFQDGHQKWCGNGFLKKFWQKLAYDCVYPKGHRNCSIWLCFRDKCIFRFTQKFEIATKMAGKLFLDCQITLWIPWG